MIWPWNTRKRSQQNRNFLTKNQFASQYLANPLFNTPRKEPNKLPPQHITQNVPSIQRTPRQSRSSVADPVQANISGTTIASISFPRSSSSPFPASITPTRIQGKEYLNVNALRRDLRNTTQFSQLPGAAQLSTTPSERGVSEWSQLFGEYMAGRSRAATETLGRAEDMPRAKEFQQLGHQNIRWAKMRPSYGEIATRRSLQSQSQDAYRRRIRFYSDLVNQALTTDRFSIPRQERLRRTRSEGKTSMSQSFFDRLAPITRPELKHYLPERDDRILRARRLPTSEYEWRDLDQQYAKRLHAMSAYLRTPRFREERLNQSLRRAIIPQTRSFRAFTQRSSLGPIDEDLYYEDQNEREMQMFNQPDIDQGEDEDDDEETSF